ncbi:hypothetical protein HPB52_010794 [Rhipicephalus sanguineus]|uniref:Uncharacterized protein n=1 Tax=Rhipicephalus sanguineus TaxID=34632 RepID=A0A9D4T3R5_RHISA|nr:hypothetical protein HPB52_010794 [Rhipicephalus sanguineus]
MAATALRGYDPTTLAWKEVSASTSEGSVPSTDIVDEGLFTVVALRKRRQQSKATKGSATDKATSAKIPPKKKTSRQPGGHHGGRGSPQQRSAPKTSDVTPEGRHPGVPNQAPKNPVAGRTNKQAPLPPKTPQTSQKTSSNTPEHSGPVLPAGDFPPLTDAGALRRPTKKTSSQQVTSNIKTWLHGANPRSRRASPLKDVNRPSKFSHAIDLPEVSEDSELLLAQGTEVGVESLPATPNSQYGDST